MPHDKEHEQSSFSVPPVAGRRGREEGQAQAQRHTARGIAEHQQRKGRVVQQQEQSHGEDGLRLQEHGQSHSAADAEALGRETAAAVKSVSADRKSGLVNEVPSHTNYRSLINQGFVIHWKELLINSFCNGK